MRWAFLLPVLVILGLGLRMNSVETARGPRQKWANMGCFRYVYLLLAGIVLMVGVSTISDKNRSLGLQRLPRMLENTREQMSVIAGDLHKYENARGHYPTNDQGLLVVKPIVNACHGHDGSDYPLCFCRAGESGILTRWGDPFIYENRRGIDRSKFADSGATLDTKRLYSVLVDNGIYVWSLGAKQAQETLDLWHPRLSAANHVVVLIALVFVGLFVRDSIMSRGRPNSAVMRWSDGIGSTFVGLALAVIIPAMLLPMLAKTCYEQSVMWMRKPKLTADYRILLTKYRDRGIISGPAYRKITDAMSEHDDRAH